MKTGQKDFLWGVASSAFQVEGQIENDMTDWENNGNFSQNGKNPVYGKAANHWDLWESDLELLEKLNVNAYRCSIEWARIEPKAGKIDQKSLQKYKAVVDKLLALNITPMLTLHHFTHPRWFLETCPWYKENSIDYFVKYAKIIIDNFIDKISWYITFNEPLVWLLTAYGDAKFPLGENDFS